MVDGIVIGVALFGIVATPLGIIALHQLYVVVERGSGVDRDATTPPTANDAAPSRTIPGNNSNRPD